MSKVARSVDDLGYRCCGEFPVARVRASPATFFVVRGEVSMLPLVEKGSQGEWVKYCQNLLNARLFDPVALWVDGQFGIKTELAVRRFQMMRKLSKVDGRVGDETWLALEAGPPLIRKRPPIYIETHGGGV